MHAYLALLRGVNVGGKAAIRMSELRTCLEGVGFTGVRTYIQSGNVLFMSDDTDTEKLSRRIENKIEDTFSVQTGVAVITKERWRDVLSNAPPYWGKDEEWKHNLLVLLEPYDMDEALAAVGELKPEIEMLVAGDGVMYQSLSWSQLGRTTGGKLASNPLYKRMTVRNYNTSQKLLALLEDLEN